MRLINFLTNWLLALGLKEGLLECAAACVKSEVILTDVELEEAKLTRYRFLHPNYLFQNGRCTKTLLINDLVFELVTACKI